MAEKSCLDLGTSSKATVISKQQTKQGLLLKAEEIPLNTYVGNFLRDADICSDICTAI